MNKKGRKKKKKKQQLFYCMLLHEVCFFETAAALCLFVCLISALWKVKRLRILVFVYYCKIGIWEGLDAACFLFCCCNIVVAKKTVGGRFFRAGR
jgi:hypothetical protein